MVSPCQRIKLRDIHPIEASAKLNVSVAIGDHVTPSLQQL